MSSTNAISDTRVPTHCHHRFFFSIFGLNTYTVYISLRRPSPIHDHFSHFLITCNVMNPSFMEGMVAKNATYPLMPPDFVYIV